MNRTCEKSKEKLLEAATNGTMEPVLAKHVRTCAACSAEWEALREHAHKIEEWLPMVAQGAELSADFQARVLAAAARRQKTRGRLRMLVLAGATACAVIVLVAGLWKRSATKLAAEELSAAQKLAEWRAPSDGLLATPGQELLTTVPKLGQTYLDVPPKADEEE